MAVARSTGRVPPELVQTPVPAAAAALWEAFASLSGTRPGGMGMAPISFTELAAWQALNGVSLTPWEADTLIEIDRAARAVVAKETAK